MLHGTRRQTGQRMKAARCGGGLINPTSAVQVRRLSKLENVIITAIVQRGNTAHLSNALA